MTIVEEKNRCEERREDVKRIKELWDIKLSYRYELEEDAIMEKNLFNKMIIADITIEEDIITINFKYEEDYRKLRNCFEESEAKFKLTVDGDYYY